MATIRCVICPRNFAHWAADVQIGVPGAVQGSPHCSTSSTCAVFDIHPVNTTDDEAPGTWWGRARHQALTDVQIDTTRQSVAEVLRLVHWDLCCGYPSQVKGMCALGSFV